MILCVLSGVYTTCDALRGLVSFRSHTTAVRYCVFLSLAYNMGHFVRAWYVLLGHGRPLACSLARYDTIFFSESQQYDSGVACMIRYDMIVVVVLVVVVVRVSGVGLDRPCIRGGEVVSSSGRPWRCLRGWMDGVVVTGVDWSRDFNQSEISTK